MRRREAARRADAAALFAQQGQMLISLPSQQGTLRPETYQDVPARTLRSRPAVVSSYGPSGVLTELSKLSCLLGEATLGVVAIAPCYGCLPSVLRLPPYQLVTESFAQVAPTCLG